MSHTVWLNGFWFSSSRDEIIPCKRLKWRNTLTRNFFNLSMTKKNLKNGRTKFQSKFPMLKFYTAKNSEFRLGIFWMLQIHLPTIFLQLSKNAAHWLLSENRIWLHCLLVLLRLVFKFSSLTLILIGWEFWLVETNQHLAQFERYKCFCCWKMLLFETEKRRFQNE